MLIILMIFTFASAWPLRIRQLNSNRGIIAIGQVQLWRNIKSPFHSRSQLNCKALESIDTENGIASYKRGQEIQVLVKQFGPMGATVEIDGGATRGLVLQKEIAMFRARRNGVDVELGEQLSAYVERVRDNGRVDVSLRPVDVSRIEFVKAEILDALEGSPGGDIPVGDKSSPDAISSYFYGLSKRDFKNAVGALYKEGKVVPGTFITTLVAEEDQDQAKATAKQLMEDKLRLKRSRQQSADGGDSKSNAGGGVPPSPLFTRRDDRTIFIGNLPVSINAVIFTNVVEKALIKTGVGIVNCRLSMDSASGKARGFGYVELLREEMVEEAMGVLRGLEIMGRAIRVDYADPNKRAATFTTSSSSSSSSSGGGSGGQLWTKQAVVSVSSSASTPSPSPTGTGQQQPQQQQQQRASVTLPDATADVGSGSSSSSSSGGGGGGDIDIDSTKNTESSAEDTSDSEGSRDGDAEGEDVDPLEAFLFDADEADDEKNQLDVGDGSGDGDGSGGGSGSRYGGEKAAWVQDAQNSLRRKKQQQQQQQQQQRPADTKASWRQGSAAAAVGATKVWTRSSSGGVGGSSRSTSSSSGYTNMNNRDAVMPRLQAAGASDGSEDSGGRGGGGSRGLKGNKNFEATLYIGNLAYAVTAEMLKHEIEHFTGQPCVAGARIVTDKDTGRKKGYGYVDVYSKEMADKIYDEMHEYELMGRRMNIDDATR